MRNRRTVYIPVVELGESTQPDQGALLQVYAQFRASLLHTDIQAGSATNKHIDPVIQNLVGAGLHREGAAAQEAIKWYHLYTPLWAVYQRLFKPISISSLQLNVGSIERPRAWMGRGGVVEGSSGQLGMALALLMVASGCRHDNVIATGRIGRQFKGIRPDVEVAEVGKVVEKLRLVIHCADRLQRDSNGKVLFFTPLSCNIEGETVLIASLPEVKQLAGQKVQVVPVKTLGEAARHLGAHRARMTPKDFLLAGGGMTALIMVSLLLWATPRLYAGILKALDPDPAPISQPQLTLQAAENDENLPLENLSFDSIEEIGNLSPSYILRLSFTEHMGKFLYVLEINGHGEAKLWDLEQIREQTSWEKRLWKMDNPVPPTHTLLLMVFQESLSWQQQETLQKDITAMGLSPKIGSDEYGLKYRFRDQYCEPLELPRQLGGFATQGPVRDPESDSHTCPAWTDRLLERLTQDYQSRLSGFTIQLDTW